MFTKYIFFNHLSKKADKLCVMMTSSQKYLCELHMHEVTCVQKLKFILAFKNKKSSVFRKTTKKVLNYIFDMIT